MVYQKLQKSSAKISPAQRTLQAPRPFSTIKSAEDSPQQDIQRSLSNSNRLEQVSVYPATSEASVLQPKLTIGAVNDPYEKEADQVAHQVVTKIHSPAFQAPQPQVKESIQRQIRPQIAVMRKPTTQGQAATATPDLEASIRADRGSGRPIKPSVKEPMEQAFGSDFSQVRIHTDAQSDQLNRSIQARAFTTGQDIFFRSGEYNPDSRAGQELMAHELTHIVQQRGEPQHIQRFITNPLTGTISQVVLQQKLINYTVKKAQSKSLLPEGYLTHVLNNHKENLNIHAVFMHILQTMNSATTEDECLYVMEKNYLDLLNAVERQFILDPKMSSLDLLDEKQAAQYKNFKWHKNDYPRGAVGPNESKAKRMTRALNAIRPERRVNFNRVGYKDAVVTETEFTKNKQLQEYITNQLKLVPNFTSPLPGETTPPKQPGDKRLNKDALKSFLQMRNAALKDGIPLIIRAAFRTPERAKANAKRANNPEAVAEFSPHILGLAFDLQMSYGKQHFIEIDTSDMQNVVNMRTSPVHKWIFLHGAKYGWYPFQNEPWHWEYNPPGFREKFHQEFKIFEFAEKMLDKIPEFSMLEFGENILDNITETFTFE